MIPKNQAKIFHLPQEHYQKNSNELNIFLAELSQFQIMKSLLQAKSHGLEVVIFDEGAIGLNYDRKYISLATPLIKKTRQLFPRIPDSFSDLNVETKRFFV